MRRVATRARCAHLELSGVTCGVQAENNDLGGTPDQVFKTTAIDHSAIPPRRESLGILRADLLLAQADLFFAGTGTPAIFTLTEKSVLLVVK